MKIALINRNDVYGGAARATLRLHNELLEQGVESVLVADKVHGNVKNIVGKSNISSKISQRTRDYLNEIPLRIGGYKYSSPFSPNFIGINIFKKKQVYHSDIIHLNWINGGFININDLILLKQPIVWTLHDVWPFTGGCHILGKCSKYINGCGKCPQLNSNKNMDISYKLVNKKNNILKNLNITFIAPSKWMAERIKESFLFSEIQGKVQIIPNGIDTKVYKPINSFKAKEELGLDKNKKVILFGAVNATSDRNKGYLLLKDALKFLYETSSNFERENIQLVVFGSDNKVEENMGFKTINIGKINDEKKLTLLYSAAEVMCVPSIQESFGQTALESIACGTPVVSFKTSGLLDIIDHKINGFTAKSYDVREFARGIQWLLREDMDRSKISSLAREKALNKFDIRNTTKQHIHLYEDLL
nr:glycosyltransferase family 4 protein [Fredinandcohnia onubensis]